MPRARAPPPVDPPILSKGRRTLHRCPPRGCLVTAPLCPPPPAGSPRSPRLFPPPGRGVPRMLADRRDRVIFLRTPSTTRPPRLGLLRLRRLPAPASSPWLPPLLAQWRTGCGRHSVCLSTTRTYIPAKYFTSEIRNFHCNGVFKTDTADAPLDGKHARAGHTTTNIFERLKSIL